MNVILIGPRGSGKTTLGRELARRLGRPFIDLDDEVRARFDGRGVAEIWNEFGEAQWREEESNALSEAIALDGRVLSLGGGVPMIDTCRMLLQAERDAGRALIIYLRCSVDSLRDRLLEAPGDRPSLTGQAVSDEIAEVLRHREPTYRVIASFEFDNTALTLDAAAGRLEEALHDCGLG